MDGYMHMYTCKIRYIYHNQNTLGIIIYVYTTCIYIDRHYKVILYVIATVWYSSVFDRHDDTKKHTHFIMNKLQVLVCDFGKCNNTKHKNL